MTPDDVDGVEPLTQGRIEDAIRRNHNRQHQLTTEFTVARDEFAQAELDFKIAWAKSRTTIRHETVAGKRLSNDAVDDKATLETEDERRAMVMVESRVDSVKQALYTERANGELLRSLLASHREVAP